MSNILEVTNLDVTYPAKGFGKQGFKALHSVSIEVGRGETLGLVGESGCGKSTVALAVMRDLGKNGRIVGGSIKFKGRDLTHMGEDELRHIRGSEIAMIYQEPMASLNPAMKIGAQLAEVPMIHQGMSKDDAWKLARQIVADVRLPDPDRIINAYPHQLSGGQQQRIVIAMALMSKPALLILDEPTTALDVTVEAGIVDLVKDLGKKYGTSMLFISHNLGLVLDVCDRLCVMYSGEAVETGNVEEVFDTMRHPYTQALFRSIPLPGADKNARPLVAIPGNFPLPHERPQGCNFGPRCDYYVEGRCNAQEIPMVAVPDGHRHETRCLRSTEIDWDAPPTVAKTTEKTEIGRVVLKLDDLKKYYSVGSSAFGGGMKKVVKANETLTFEAREGETLAIVGESGCGKSMTALSLMRLAPDPPCRIAGGSIVFEGRDTAGRERHDVREHGVIPWPQRQRIACAIGKAPDRHVPGIDVELLEGLLQRGIDRDRHLALFEHLPAQWLVENDQIGAGQALFARGLLRDDAVHFLR